jgi:hypothetical protein
MVQYSSASKSDHAAASFRTLGSLSAIARLYRARRIRYTLRALPVERDLMNNENWEPAGNMGYG